MPGDFEPDDFVDRTTAVQTWAAAVPPPRFNDKLWFRIVRAAAARTSKPRVEANAAQVSHLGAKASLNL